MTKPNKQTLLLPLSIAITMIIVAGSYFYFFQNKPKPQPNFSFVEEANKKSGHKEEIANCNLKLPYDFFDKNSKKWYMRGTNKLAETYFFLKKYNGKYYLRCDDKTFGGVIDGEVKVDNSTEEISYQYKCESLLNGEYYAEFPQKRVLLLYNKEGKIFGYANLVK